MVRKARKSRFQKELVKEIEEVEAWVKERKKFFIKLGWTIGFIALLLLVSHLYLRTRGLSLW